MTALIHTLFPHETAPARIKGEVRFVAAEDRSQAHGSLGLLLTVRVPTPPWSAGAGGGRRLRDAIESAIESALEMNDAPPSGVGGLGDLDQCLSDQLYRARSVGAGGLAIFLPNLTSTGSLSGVLDAEDSAVLRWWIAATTERPVMLLVDNANRRLGAYGPPAAIEHWVDQRGAETARARVQPSPKKSAHEEPTIAATPRPSTVRDIDAHRTEVALHVTVTASTNEPATEDKHRNGSPDDTWNCNTRANGAHSNGAEADGTQGESETNGPHANGAHANTHLKGGGTNGTLPSATAENLGPRRREVDVPRERAPAASHVEITGLHSLDADRGNLEADLTYAIEQPLPTAPAADRVVPLFPPRESPFRKPYASGFAVGGGPVDWRGFASDLALARGPKPLTFVERLFMTRYVPLMEAIARGEADDAARRTAEQWADDFARSYTEGFSALRVTGKRPRMVLDAPQLASQVARLHGAKSTHLILIDAMRFDLGVRVHDRMCEALTSQATCTERLLLWSALPTTTPTQMDLLAHGPDGLANRPPPSEQEEAGFRGRAAPVLRRIKIGGRDLLKLDLVQSRLYEQGPPLGERLDGLADEVANIVSAHARSLPPRSLMLVFGDHGFRMDSTEHGTSAGSSGSARPEEVLVPGFAWLVGDVH
jgi:hypothetical protein